MTTPLRFMDACPRCKGPIVAKQCLDETCSLGRMGQNEQELTVDLEQAEAERDALLKAAKALLDVLASEREDLPSSDAVGDARDALRAAVNKAEGKS